MKTAEDWFQEGLAVLERSRGADHHSEYHADLDDALGSFNLAINLDPAHARAQRSRGMLLLHLRDPEAALDSFIAASSLEAPDADLHLAVGQSLLALKHWERALAAFEQALRQRSDDGAALVGRAEALTGLERDELALTAWDEALQVLDTRMVEHHGKLSRDLTDDWRAGKARQARAVVAARRG